jgi:MurNAc alpha-1-phosphate uridylyltransferase
MRAMILAAGRGARMGALTDNTPKPLLKVGGAYLIEYSLLALAKTGIKDIVINISYHRDQIKAALGDGRNYGVNIMYSEEPEALETGGGIFQALPLLGTEPFIVVSGDIVTDYPFANLPTTPVGLAHLIMVENPDFHTQGDFSIRGSQICLPQEKTYTYGNIGLFRPELFAGCVAGKFRVAELFKHAIPQNQITGELYSGFWRNIGTAEQLSLGVVER